MANCEVVAAPPEIPLWTVPRAWPGETVVCVGSGPSLQAQDVEACRGRARVIVINDTYQLAPWADVLYACDGAWWTWHQGAPEFQGLKVGGTRNAAKWPGVHRLEMSDPNGLSLNPQQLCHGRNSGYQAINLAVLFGAARILLLGYDMQVDEDGRGHYFGEHPNGIRSPYQAFLEQFPTLVGPLADLGVEVINCTRRTALTCFRCAPLEETL